MLEGAIKTADKRPADARPADHSNQCAAGRQSASNAMRDKARRMRDAGVRMIQQAQSLESLADRVEHIGGAEEEALWSITVSAYRDNMHF